MTFLRNFHFRRHIIIRKNGTLFKRHHIFDAIFQLPHISWPVICSHNCQSFIRNPPHFLVQDLVVLFDKIFAQNKNIFFSFPERRNMDRHNI